MSVTVATATTLRPAVDCRTDACSRRESVGVTSASAALPRRRRPRALAARALRRPRDAGRVTGRRGAARALVALHGESGADHNNNNNHLDDDDGYDNAQHAAESSAPQPMTYASELAAAQALFAHLPPDDPWPAFSRGTVHLRFRHPARAVTDLARAVALGFRVSYTLNWLAAARFRAGDTKSAVQDYRRAVTDDVASVGNAHGISSVFRKEFRAWMPPWAPPGMLFQRAVCFYFAGCKREAYDTLSVALLSGDDLGKSGLVTDDDDIGHDDVDHDDVAATAADDESEGERQAAGGGCGGGGGARIPEHLAREYAVWRRAAAVWAKGSRDAATALSLLPAEQPVRDVIAAFLQAEDIVDVNDDDDDDRHRASARVRLHFYRGLYCDALGSTDPSGKYLHGIGGSTAAAAADEHFARAVQVAERVAAASERDGDDNAITMAVLHALDNGAAFLVDAARVRLGARCVSSSESSAVE